MKVTGVPVISLQSRQCSFWSRFSTPKAIALGYAILSNTGVSHCRQTPSGTQQPRRPGDKGRGEAPLGRGCREPAKGYSTMGIILFLVKGLLGLVPIKNNKKNKFNFFFCIQTTDRMRSGNK